MTNAFRLESHFLCRQEAKALEQSDSAQILEEKNKYNFQHAVGSGVMEQRQEKHVAKIMQKQFEARTRSTFVWPKK